MTEENNNIAVVLMNLGSPESPEVKDVRTYLNEFLMDKRVIDVPYLLRLALVRGIVSPLRAPNSAKAYKTIWTDRGSPLIFHSKDAAEALEKKNSIPIEIAMRYGNPHPKVAIDRLLQRVPNLERLLLIPMYPHYAMSSFETAVEYFKKTYDEGDYDFELSVIQPFYDNAEFIDTLAKSIESYMKEDFDHLLFSYHGIPARHVKKTDPSRSHCMKVEDCCKIKNEAHDFCYRHQVIETTHLAAKALNLNENQYSFSFQSRLGRDEWLKPYTVNRLEEMPREGIKKLLVVCPAFTADCLETIEEIAEEGKEIFEEAGGESFQLIPCLNSQEIWIDTMAKWLNDFKTKADSDLIRVY